MKLVKEYINFNRGIEPKSAMETGVWADILKNPPQQIHVEAKKDFNLDFLVFQKGTRCVLSNIVNKNNNKFTVGYRAYRDDGRCYALGNLNATINEFDEYFKVLKIDESLNFKRGLEPKTAMGIDITRDFPKYHDFIKYHEWAKKHTDDVSEIDYSLKEPRFIVKVFVPEKTFTVYLTKREGIIIFNDENDWNRDVENLKQFKQFIEGADHENIDFMTQHPNIDETFKRNIEPSDAMGTSVDVQIKEFVKKRYGVQLDMNDSDGARVALHYCIIAGHEEYVKYLVCVKKVIVTDRLLKTALTNKNEEIILTLTTYGNINTMDWLKSKKKRR